MHQPHIFEIEQNKKLLTNLSSTQLLLRDISNIFLIYFKTPKIIIINVLWRHSRKTTQKKNSTEIPNSCFLL